MTIQTFKNVIVVGGSYVGCAAATNLAAILPKTHRVLVIEPHSHFNHLFAFPRFAVVPSYEHKAFIPYSGLFSKLPSESHSHQVIQAKVIDIKLHSVIIDKEYPIGSGSGNYEIPFEYLVLATGTRLSAPGNVPNGMDEKHDSIKYFRKHQECVKDAKDIVIVGGGAVGVQMATDIKEYYPQKQVTLVHSRDHLMPRFHPEFSSKIKDRFAELGIKTVLGSRAIIPNQGFPSAVSPVTVGLQDGRNVKGDFVIFATGQTPNTQMLTTLVSLSSSPDELINPLNGFVKVRKTTQLAPEDTGLDHIFAVGDIADSGAHKAARPGSAHAQIAAENILSMINGEKPTKVIKVDPAAIHMTLGIQKNVVCGNPAPEVEDGQPFFRWKEDGKLDMGVNGVWERRGVIVTDEAEYHL